MPVPAALRIYRRPDFRFYRTFPKQATDAVIRVYDAAGNVVETDEHKGDFKEW